jgi:hypothetical protein
LESWLSPLQIRGPPCAVLVWHRTAFLYLLDQAHISGHGFSVDIIVFFLSSLFWSVFRVSTWFFGFLKKCTVLFPNFVIFLVRIFWKLNILQNCAFLEIDFSKCKHFKNYIF